MRRKRKAPSTRKDKRGGVARENYNVPDELDLQILQDTITKLSKSLDSEGKPKPLTEKQFIQMIRSAVREKWMHCDAKLAKLNSCKEPDLDPNSRTRFKITCNKCKNKFKADEVEVDHIKQEESFTCIKDAFKWASSILNAGGDDLQCLCKECHAIKTHMELLDCTWEEAIADKEAIRIQKIKGYDKEWLTSMGLIPESNSHKRRQQIVNYLLKRNDNEK